MPEPKKTGQGRNERRKVSRRREATKEPPPTASASETTHRHGPYWSNELLEIRDWLKETKTRRKDIATKLGVSLGTVNNWLCGNRPIPQRVRVRIQAHNRYIPSEGSVLEPRCRAVAAPLTGAEYAEVLSAAMQTNYTVEELASAGLMSLVRGILQGEVHLAQPLRQTVE